MRTLHVLKQDRPVGELRAEDTEPPQYTFVYRAEAQDADFVSLTMPPSAQSVWGPRTTLHPIFDMNLPEGERRLYVERAARVAAADDFTLLQAIGARQIGLLRFVSDPANPQPKVTPLNPQRLQHIENGLEFFESVFKDLTSSSGISGVQPKVLAATQQLRDGATSLPGTLITDSHILKRDRDAYRGMVISEYLCTQALKQAELPVVHASLSEDGTLLVLERFDRNHGVALHFEEFCSLMGKTSKDKYDTSYERVVQSVQTFVAPQSRQRAVTDLFRALVANRLVGNADAHLKNFGVLCTNFNDIHLAPFYDVVSTRAFEDVPPGITLQGKAAWSSYDSLVRFGRYCGLSGRETQAQIAAVCDAVEATVPQIDEAATRYEYFRLVADRMRVIWRHALEEVRTKRHRPQRPALKYPKHRRRMKVMGPHS